MIVRSAAAVVAAVFSLSGAACGPVTLGHEVERTQHVDGEGPLSASSGEGGSSIFAPDAAPWYASFGAFVLCSTDPDSQIVLEGARFRAREEPLSFSTSMREVTPADLRRASRTARHDYAPWATDAGRPPDFAEPYAGGVPPGTFRMDIAGVPVDHDCDAKFAEGQGFQELWVTLEADRGGADVPDVYVDYTADGEPMTLHIQWGMIACGHEIADKDVC